MNHVLVKRPLNRKGAIAASALGAFLLSQVALHSALLGAIGLGGALAIALYGLKGIKAPWAKWVRLSLCLVFGLAAIVSMGQPASAQFFGGAQTFFQENFGGENDATDIVFNAIRALYLLYIAIAFVGVVNAVRQDEDWQTVARTPLLVVVVVTVADVITQLVVGGAGA